MPRISALDDRFARNRALDVIRNGGTIHEAAVAAGCTRQAINRYMLKHDDFRRAVDAARADGQRAQVGEQAVAAATPAAAEVVVREKKANPAGPGPDQYAAAEVLGVDVDLIADADESMPELPEKSVPEINVHNAIAFHWRTMHNPLAPPGLRSTSAQIMARLQFGPLVEAQTRRIAALERRALAVESSGDGPQVDRDAKPRGGGSRVVVVPPNPARPWLGAPETVDAEVVE